MTAGPDPPDVVPGRWEIRPPRLVELAIRFPRPQAGDVIGATRAAVDRVLADQPGIHGAEIGVTVGSRGITGIATIARAAIDTLRARGARPFVIPAMGSHGGATSHGQRRLLEHYGVTEETMGVPIRDAMAARSLGRTPEGVEAFMAETAWAADGVLLLNRVKPHTDFKGDIESGLAKICSIGLGKLEGARECHGRIFDIGLGAAMRSAAARVLASGKILGGVAILENAYHETARIAAVTAADLFAEEELLLREARSLMGKLPLSEIDVLLCEQMGKNISGAGLDTNVIGRSVYGYAQGIPWHPGLPLIRRIVVRDLTAESEGNAVGMGMVDFVPRRFAAKVDSEVTALNAITARSPENARWPIVADTDRECLRLALETAPQREGGALVLHVRDTLELGRVFASEPCLPLLHGREDVEVVGPPAPLRFESDGSLVSPFR